MTAEIDAGRLHNYAWNGLDWQDQCIGLMRVRDDVNRLGRGIIQLQTEMSLPPSQQRLVRRVAWQVNLTANDTEVCRCLAELIETTF
jgi:hypothetical protein